MPLDQLHHGPDCKGPDNTAQLARNAKVKRRKLPRRNMRKEMSTSLNGCILILVKMKAGSLYDPELGIHVVVAEDDDGVNDG